MKHKIHLKPSSDAKAESMFWTVYHAHANGFSRDDVEYHIYICNILILLQKIFYSKKKDNIEKQNGCVCTKLSFRLMQISLNVDVYECQECLNRQ